MTTMIFKIPGEPTGKGRPRYANVRGVVRTYTPKKTRDYERRVQQFFRKAYPGYIPLDGPVSVYIYAVFPVPESFSMAKKQRCYSGELLPTKKPDADNIAKIVLDALNGLAYRDDAHVTAMSANKRFQNAPDEPPHIRVELFVKEGNTAMIRDYPEPSMTPPEPVEVRKCACCGGEIYAGNRAYRGDEGLFHPGCLLPFIAGKLEESYVAAALGYQEVIAQ